MRYRVLATAWAGVAFVALQAAGPAPVHAASAYRADGVRWPGGLVPYYNAVPSQAWALQQAVAAWNRSGARVRFVPSPRSGARVVIRPGPSTALCRSAQATIGFVWGATVRIFPGGDASTSCNRYTAAVLLVHELGHVLGLRHENRGCAAMNAWGSYRGGARCERERLWEWHCQLLERDDVLGAIALYGGSPRPRRTAPMCSLYEPIGPPLEPVASYDAEHRGISLRFERRPDPSLPGFLAPLAHGRQRAFAYLGLRDRCPTAEMIEAAPRYAWPVGANVFSRLIAQPTPGDYCYATWSIDGLGRPSADVATAWVRVPPA